MRVLAESGALEPLEADRRHAAWKIQGLWSQLPLFAAQSRREPPAPLPPVTESEILQQDYRTTGVAVGRHVVQVLRAALEGRGVRRAVEVRKALPGEHLEVFGLVSCRQRPPTAGGVAFLTLEDETGMVNLVIWPRVWKEFRVLAREAKLLGACGRVQRDGAGESGAVSVLVERLWKLDHEVPGSPPSRDFH